jgi:phospholipid/cholesterol/gamma-HCH transport system substrate-binding protein
VTKRKSELQAGMFVAMGIAVFTVAIFLLGQKSALFTRNTELFAAFKDISGLAVGAPVRLAGLEVGTVAAISFPPDPRDKQARVRLIIRSRFMERIRSDSEAFIDSTGLLGDKVVNISMGSPDASPLHEGSSLKTRASAGFEALSANLGDVIQSLVHISGKVENLINDDRTRQIQVDVSRITASLANVMAQVESGDGLAHRVLYDRTLASQTEAAVFDARQVVQKAQHAIDRTDAILAEVQQGEGTAHELIYGQSGKTTLVALSQSAQQINEVLRSVKDGSGVLHALVYDADQGAFLRDLNQMSATLNRIVQDVDKGRGSVGGLLRDPTVYEDLKSLLGNVQRNVVFKSLVRLTLERDHVRRVDGPGPQATDDAQAPKVLAGDKH